MMHIEMALKLSFFQVINFQQSFHITRNLLYLNNPCKGNYNYGLVSFFGILSLTIS